MLNFILIFELNELLFKRKKNIFVTSIKYFALQFEYRIRTKYLYDEIYVFLKKVLHRGVSVTF